MTVGFIGIFSSVLSEALYPAQETEIYVASASVVATSSPPISIQTPAPLPKPSKSIPIPIQISPKLSIPSLSINAKIEKVGINTKGNIASPTTFQTVGLYKYGPKPGEKGTALIDGHLNNGLGLSGVFANLDSIKIGDLVIITDEKNNKQQFEVYAKSSADYTAHLSDILPTENDNTPRLMLVTCDGDWVADQKTYDKRVIVLARKI